MFGFLLEPQRGDLVGVVAVLGADFVFGDAHPSVEFEGVVVEVVAHGVEGDLVGDDGFLLGADAVDDGGDGFDGGVGVVGLVVGEQFEGVEGVDVFLEFLGGDAAAGAGGHAVSFGLCGRAMLAETSG